MKKILLFILIVFTSFNMMLCEKENTNTSSNSGGNNNPPLANFTVSSSTGDAPKTISFTDKSSYSSTSWFWEFGDGITSNEKNPSHIYTKLGKYTVKLTVSNADGSNSKILTNAITVYEIRTYISSLIGPFYPARTNGDAEFGAHGPYVKVTADLLAPAGGVSGGGETVRLKLSMYAKETVSDWSTAYGEWYINIATLPDDATFKEFASPVTSCWATYTDTDHDYDYSGNLQLGEFASMGDTSGDDICSGGCNSSDTHLYFKNFYCKVRIQPK